MKKINLKWQLIAYDILVLLFVDFLILCLYAGNHALETKDILIQMLLSLACILPARLLGGVYQQIWRYGGIQCYIRLLIVDGCAFAVNLLLEKLLPIVRISFVSLLAIASVNLLGALALRMVYRYAYKCAGTRTAYGRFLNGLLRVFAGKSAVRLNRESAEKIKIAIVGAGRIGVALAEELLANPNSAYEPRCFVDIKQEKVNRDIHNIPVYLEDDSIFSRLEEKEIKEVVFAVPDTEQIQQKNLYERYMKAGYKIKVYDYPVTQVQGGKRHMRQFDIEELLFRKPVVIHEEKTNAYYRDKVILITGGGGSIGSELCRQLARMQPRKIIILDIYENGAYDVQQELKIAYGTGLDIQIEIASICNERAMDRIFAEYRPQIVINAAAHKHVPLMEHNCVEAVENNVFGTALLLALCEKYETGRFMMVSTDKAVNPTNVMGATKRMCEMLVQSASTRGKVTCSSTRFGNVLGSAGSVIPLFKRQIANGGPITLTDKRIIRYFMTIPEAAQLVLQSGAMAKNGELFVLDMGQPVKIYDLARNMIRLSGVTGIEIVETGLRPGEKLYEELLVRTEELDKTENSLIYIEREAPLPSRQMEEKLKILQEACQTGDDDAVRDALKRVVPTYRSPEQINADVENSREMQDCRQFQTV